MYKCKSEWFCDLELTNTMEFWLEPMMFSFPTPKCTYTKIYTFVCRTTIISVLAIKPLHYIIQST